MAREMFAATEEEKPQVPIDKPVTAPVTRDSKGRMLKGFSSNPSGKPKDWAECLILARSYSIPCLERLYYLALHSKSEFVQIKACSSILKIAYPDNARPNERPAQAMSPIIINLNGNDTKGLPIDIEALARPQLAHESDEKPND